MPFDSSTFIVTRKGDNACRIVSMTMGNSGHDQAINHDDGDDRSVVLSKTAQAKCCGRNHVIKPLAIFAVCLAAPVLFSVLKDRSAKNIWRVLDFKLLKKDHGENLPLEVEGKQAKPFGDVRPGGFDKKSSQYHEENPPQEVKGKQAKPFDRVHPGRLDKTSSQFVKENRTRPVEGRQEDKFLGGLIPPGFTNKSCLSRYQSLWKTRGHQTHQPSSHLISRLRDYESLHKRCGPQTNSFRGALEHLNSGKNISNFPDSGCKYAVWVARDGLGNRMITLVSTFLYALLTDRVLLVDPGVHISDLFCEPFPESSWLIPSNFPPNIISWGSRFDQNSPKSYGYMLKKKKFSGSYAYIYLVNNYNYNDQRFFCGEDQAIIQKIPWIFMRSNQYFAPSLFLMPSFQEELNDLFPEKETVFHFLGRYLFNPTNPVWSLITRYYESHLAMSDGKIGVQIRIFKTNPDPFDHVLNQTLSCLIKNNLLPQIKHAETFITDSSGKSNRTAVLITSLSSRYHDAVKKMYEEHQTVTGEIVRVHQPSNEVHQDSRNRIHNMKAWAEMYLLSLSDKLVTSSKSTFGYVAQSLGGLTPWILYKPDEYSGPENPGCQRALSMEPCFQAPPKLDCKTRKRIDQGKIVGHVGHCEDMKWTRGLKLFDKDDEP